MTELLSFLEPYGTAATQRRTTALRIVEPLNVVENTCSGLLPVTVYLAGRALTSLVASIATDRAG